MAGNFDHLIDDSLAIRPVFHIFHLLKQPVIFRIVVIGRVFSLAFDLTLRSIQQEQKIFRVRIIGVPSPVENLGVALSDFFLKSVIIRGPDHQLQVELAELFSIPIKARFVVRTAGSDIDVKHQRFTVFLINPIRITGLG